MKSIYKPLFNKKHIILCFAHANTLGLIRSIGKEGIKPIVVGLRCSTKNKAIYKSRYISELYLVDSYEEGIDFIVSKYAEASKNFLYLMSDAGVVICEKRHEELKKYFYFFNSGSTDVLSSCMDKEFLCKLAEKCNLPTPSFEIVKRGELPKKLTYPIFIKSRNPFNGWKVDVAICNNSSEILEKYNSFVADEWIMQNFINKKAEISLQGISINNGNSIYMPYIKKYIRLRDTDYGTYMCYYKNNLSEEVLANISQYLKHLNYSGCFEIEFLQDYNDKLYFLEVNFRFSASNQGMYWGGVNLPLEWALAELTGEIRNNIKLRDDKFYVMNEFLDIHNIFNKKISFSHWIKDFIKSYKFIFDSKDIVPMLYTLTFTIKDKIKRVLNR